MSENFYERIDEELRGYPKKSDPPDFYRFAQRVIGRFIQENRASAVNALRSMASSGFERDVLIALESIEAFRVTELEADLQILLSQIKHGQYLRPYFEGHFSRAIDALHNC